VKKAKWRVGLIGIIQIIIMNETELNTRLVRVQYSSSGERQTLAQHGKSPIEDGTWRPSARDEPDQCSDLLRVPKHSSLQHSVDALADFLSTLALPSSSFFSLALRLDIL